MRVRLIKMVRKTRSGVAMRKKPITALFNALMFGWPLAIKHHGRPPAPEIAYPAALPSRCLNPSRSILPVTSPMRMVKKHTRLPEEYTVSLSAQPRTGQCHVRRMAVTAHAAAAQCSPAGR
jgi:hypothetical protein